MSKATYDLEGRELIKARVRFMGHTMTGIAEELGVSRSLISNVLAGRAQSGRAVKLLAEKAGMTVPDVEMHIERSYRSPYKRATEEALA